MGPPEIPLFGFLAQFIDPGAGDLFVRPEVLPLGRQDFLVHERTRSLGNLLRFLGVVVLHAPSLSGAIVKRYYDRQFVEEVLLPRIRYRPFGLCLSAPPPRSDCRDAPAALDVDELFDRREVGVGIRDDLDPAAELLGGVLDQYRRVDLAVGVLDGARDER